MLHLVADAFSCSSSGTFQQLCNTLKDHAPEQLISPLVERVLPAVLVFAAVYIGGRILRRVLFRTVERAGGDPQVRTLVRNVTTVLTYTFAVLGALVAGGLDISVLLTFGGLASLAVGLAFQDLLRNILAGIWLLGEHPFRIGDLIAVGDNVGVVQNISLRTTSLRTGDGRLAILPNLTAFSGVVINANAFSQRQQTVNLRLPAGADLEEALRACRRELEAIKQVSKQPEPAVSPQIDGEAVILHCSYWVDYRSFDADQVSADVARRLWIVGVRDRAPGKPPAR